MRLQRHWKWLLKESPDLNLSYYGLEGLTSGQPVTLYHGTTASFKAFDIGKSRDELVNAYYGKGLFFTPSKRVAWKYANANRNMGLPFEVIQDLKSVNKPAGEFLEAIYKEGPDAWETFARAHGFWNDDPPPGEGTFDSQGFQQFLKVDPNTISDIADFIPGAKKGERKDNGLDDFTNIFSGSTGSPEWMYDLLDDVGLDSSKYRPKVYTVSVTASRVLVTKDKEEARQASSNGYDAVVFYGEDLVEGIPEVAVFSSDQVKILDVEVQ